MDSATEASLCAWAGAMARAAHSAPAVSRARGRRAKTDWLTIIAWTPGNAGKGWTSLGVGRLRGLAAAMHAGLRQVGLVAVALHLGQREGGGDEIEPAHAQEGLVGHVDVHAHQPPASQRHGHGKAAPDHQLPHGDRKSTRLNSSHSQISYAVFCLKKKTIEQEITVAWDLARTRLEHVDVDLKPAP